MSLPEREGAARRRPWHRLWLATLLAAVSDAACKDDPDPLCTIERCRVLVECTGVSVPGMPDVAGCQRKAGPPPEGFDEPAYCPAACAAAGAGEVLECLSAEDSPTRCNLPACRDPDREPLCTERCNRTRRTCEADCPTDSFSACADCSARCGLDEATCMRRCPFPAPRR